MLCEAADTDAEADEATPEEAATAAEDIWLADAETDEAASAWMRADAADRDSAADEAAAEWMLAEADAGIIASAEEAPTLADSDASWRLLWR